MICGALLNIKSIMWASMIFQTKLLIDYNISVPPFVLIHVETVIGICVLHIAIHPNKNTIIINNNIVVRF